MLTRFINKMQPKFCRKCGSLLETRTRGTTYDEQTGIRTIIRFLACPRAAGDTRNEWESRYAQCSYG